MGTAIKHPLPDWVKPSFVIFDIRALWHSGLQVRVQFYKWLLNPAWHRMLYTCTNMATVGVKGLKDMRENDVLVGVKCRSQLLLL